jgi:hypothetical protein
LKFLDRICGFRICFADHERPMMSRGVPPRGRGGTAFELMK